MTQPTHSLRLRCVSGPFRSATLMRLICLIALGLTALGGRPRGIAIAAEKPASGFEIDRLQKHVYFLADDSLGGREAGSDGSRAAGVYLTEQLTQAGLEPGGRDGTYYQEFNRRYRNILATIPGTDPNGPVVIVGAHYDHVGLGNSSNSHGPWGRVHNGADDNASGTAVLLELARQLKNALLVDGKSTSDVTVIFAFWDAEESGLRGSRYWLRAPTVPVGRVKLLVNLDMVGRLRNDKLIVYGWRTAPGLRHFVAPANSASALKLEFNTEIRGDSDHYPFYQRQVPFLMFFTGKHEDYHRPSDDPQKLNLPGMRSVGQLVEESVLAVIDSQTDLQFRSRARYETGPAGGIRRTGTRVQSRLGIKFRKPADLNGHVVVSSIVTESPADQGGLQVGDTILEFGGRQLTDEFDFRTLVLAAPTVCPVTVERTRSPQVNGTDDLAEGDVDAETLQLELQLDGGPMRVGTWWALDPADPDVIVLDTVVPGSPVWVAGLRVGDRVWEIAETPVDVQGSPKTQLLNSGEEFSIKYERQGVLKVADVKLLPKAGERPAGPVAAESGDGSDREP